MKKLLSLLVLAIAIGGGLYAANIVAGTDHEEQKPAEATSSQAAETPSQDSAAHSHDEADHNHNHADTAAENSPASDDMSAKETGVAASGHALITPTTYGNNDAALIIREYASFTCSHCAHFHNDILPELKTRYLDTGKAQLHMYSFIRNEQDLRATQLIQCQENNDARVKFTKALLSSQEQWAYSADYLNNLRVISQVGGFSNEKFNACMENKELETALLESREWYVSQLNVESTPYFFVKTARIKGARDISSFSSVIDPLLKE